MIFDDKDKILADLEHPYDWFQEEELELCKERGIDTTSFEDPSVSYLVMRELRLGFEGDMNLVPYMSYPAGVIKQIRIAKASNIDIIPYVKSGYDAEQLEAIRAALAKDIAIGAYITNEYRGKAILEIAVGIEHGIDISEYNSVQYDHLQMHEIRLGIEHHIDVSVYQNPLYSWEQMAEIRLGLEEYVDVNSYKSFVNTAQEMRKKRLDLCHNTNYFSYSKKKNAKKEVEAFEIKNLSVEISDDLFTAILKVNGKVDPVDRDTFYRWLQSNDVYSGIDECVVEEIIGGVDTIAEYTIARGCHPLKGEKGYYDYNFDVNAATVPKVFDDGVVGFDNLKWYAPIKANDLVARYNISKPGVDGYLVTGDVLKGGRGREQKIIIGSGIYSEHGNTSYFAENSGKIELNKGKIAIIPILEIEELAANSAPITFDGFVHVKGNVHEGNVIKATNDILVDGVINASSFESNKNLVFLSGIKGDENSKITAGESVISRYIEGCEVKAKGNIYADYLLNSSVSTDQMIILRGSKGRIIGGKCQAVGGIDVDSIGNFNDIGTNIHIGNRGEYFSDLYDVKKEIFKVNQELLTLTDAYDEYIKKDANDAQKTLIRIENAIFTKHNEYKELEKKRLHCEELVEESTKISANIAGDLFANINFVINGVKWKSQHMNHISITSDGKKVLIGEWRNDYDG